MCFIKKGEQYQILSNGFVVYKNKSYSLADCTFEDTDQTPSSVQEIEVDSQNNVPSEVKKDKSDLKKEQKPKREKKVAQPHPQDENGASDQQQDDNSSSTSKTEHDMPPIPQVQQPVGNLNIQVPNAQQVLTPQQLLQLQQLQLQLQQQQMLQGQQAVQPSSQPIPVPSIIPSADPKDTTTTGIQVPEELKMLQDFMHLTGGNMFLAIALVAAALFYKQWKAKNEGKTDNSQIDAHTSVCDLERKDLSSKIASIEAKTQKLKEIEEKITAIEEDMDRDINLGFSDEIEERLLDVEKQLRDITKIQASLERKLSSQRETTTPNTESEIQSESNSTTSKRGRKPNLQK
jgi:hypothetical protein